MGINHGWRTATASDRHGKDRFAAAARWSLGESAAASGGLVGQHQTGTRAREREDEDYGLGWWISQGADTVRSKWTRRAAHYDYSRQMAVMMVGIRARRRRNVLLRALRSDSALPSDRAGQARLQAALRLVSAPPPAHAVSRSPIAQQVSGKRYAIAENRLSLSSLSIEFPDSATALLHLRLTDGTALDQTLGETA